MKQDTLSNRITDNQPLTEEEIEACLALFGKYCRAKTWRMLKFALGHIECKANYGIFGRVIFHENGQVVQYCAGQSYPDEIRTVRQLIIEG